MFYIVIIVAGIYISDVGPFISNYECIYYKDTVVSRDIENSFSTHMKYGMNMDRWGFNEIVTYNDYNLECLQK